MVEACESIAGAEKLFFKVMFSMRWLIRRSAWFSVGGYTHIMCLEDWTLVQLIEAGFHGLCAHVFCQISLPRSFDDGAVNSV